MIFESRYLDDLGRLFNKPSVRFALSIEGFQVQDLSLWTDEMQEQWLFMFSFSPAINETSDVLFFVEGRSFSFVGRQIWGI